MKHKSYKNIITFVAICFLGTAFAQKFDKKFTENFKTNNNVEVAINASNTEINVTTWNKNEVQVSAFIEVEGISKKEAEKYFKNWNFEALGNKNKVQITSKGNRSSRFKNDFVFSDDFDIQIPEIDMSNIETIVMPNIDFDFDLENISAIVKDFDIDETVVKNGKYSFMWKDDEHDIEINSKEEWEAFKKTKDYKELKEKLKIDKEKMRKEFVESKKLMKKELEKAKLEIKQIDKERIKEELERANAEIKKMKLNFSSDSKDVIINGKKVKINKRIEIKVPKGATFDLNTRHCKVKLPNAVASGNVKYGSFNANNLLGGKLNIDYSKVTINHLNACTLFLNNVTDAKIASVTNTAMSNNSSGVNINRVNQNVNITDKFGELTIQHIIPKFEIFKLVLDNSEAKISLSTSNDKLKLMASNMVLPTKISTHKKVSVFNGHIRANSIDKKFKIEGENSKLTIIRENL